MSFAIIQYADGKSHLINTNCRNVSLLYSLRQHCFEVLKVGDQIDVADEYGECKFLTRSLEAYASDVIAPREKLVLVKVETATKADNLAGNFKFIPLLNSLTEDKEFLSTLNPVSSQKAPAANKAVKIVKNVIRASHLPGSAEKDKPERKTTFLGANLATPGASRSPSTGRSEKL